jgi:hypothetical protein
MKTVEKINLNNSTQEDTISQDMGEEIANIRIIIKTITLIIIKAANKEAARVANSNRVAIKILDQEKDYSTIIKRFI